jgi:hypothetical protein
MLSDFLHKHADDFLYGGFSAVVIWFLVNMIGKPILAIRDARHEALRVAERYAYFGRTDIEGRAAAVRREIYDTASGLTAHARGSSSLVRGWCRLAQYNLEAAASGLRGIGEMAGEQHDELTRQNTLSHVYVSLHADSHLSAEVLRQYRTALAAGDQSAH